MLKYILFFAIALGLTASASFLIEKSQIKTFKKDTKDAESSQKPSLIVNEKSKNSKVSYAEGYNESDFNSIKEPEEMFKTEEEIIQQSAGGLWEIFLKLRFDISYDVAIDDVVMRPKFTPEIKKYNNQWIEIKGYIIPNDIVHGAAGARGNGTMFMLSAFPTATCFFCKGAGPESVMEVYPSKPIPFSKNAVTIKGKLELNELDYLKMAYILKNAQIIDK